MVLTQAVNLNIVSFFLFCFTSNFFLHLVLLLFHCLPLLFLPLCFNDSSGLIVFSLLSADHEAEALGDVGVLHALLHHQAPLAPQGDHGGEQGEAVDVGVVVVVPQLVQRKEGPRSTHSCTAVNQDGTQIDLKLYPYDTEGSFRNLLA